MRRESVQEGNIVRASEIIVTSTEEVENET